MMFTACPRASIALLEYILKVTEYVIVVNYFLVNICHLHKYNSCYEQYIYIFYKLTF
jgi:hypothetical protein